MLSKDLSFQYYRWEYNENQNDYINERLKAAIKVGLFPIIYTSSRVKIPYTKLLKTKNSDNNRVIIGEILYKTYITKSSKWSYEKEWRLLFDQKISEYFNHKLPFPFIKRIYLGCSVEKHNAEAMYDIASELNIEIFQMKMRSDRFLLDAYQLDDYFINRKKWLKQIPFSV